MLDFLIVVAIGAVLALNWVVAMAVQEWLAEKLDWREPYGQRQRAEETQEAIGKTHISQTLEEGPTA